MNLKWSGSKTFILNSIMKEVENDLLFRWDPIRSKEATIQISIFFPVFRDYN